MPFIQGHLLVASPYLPDPNFYRSVVLMMQHDEDGAIGLILNRPTDNTLDDVCELFCESTAANGNRLIHNGGPVSGQIMALHGNERLSEGGVVPGVFFTTAIHLLKELVRRDDDSVLLFSGYAGWAGGQLENELTMGGWLTKPATSDDVFGEHEDLWRAVVQDIGFNILAPSIKGRLVPGDPSLN
jgi:putative transcriptional regulator